MGDQLARQTSPFRADSADGAAVPWRARPKNTQLTGKTVFDILGATRHHRRMQRLQAFKYELMPDGEQRRQMQRVAGSCRYVFNKALKWQKKNQEAGGKFIGYVAMARQLTVWRNTPQTAWLKKVPVHPLQHALKNLERAYKNFFEKRADFPRFKRKGQSDSFRYPDPKQIKLDQHKLQWRGGWLVAVPPRNTSRTCPACSHAAKDNRPSQAVSGAWLAATKTTPIMSVQ